MEKPTPAVGIRERNRLELTAEILKVGREHLIAHGPSELSLRAITRDLGMASSAIYRYFASRDDLLTALIIEAYNDLADQVELAAHSAVATEGGFALTWSAISHALRNWALANPQRWALIYGTPIVGYAAPNDTIAAATRVTIPMLQALVRDQVVPADSSITPFSTLDPNLQKTIESLGLGITEADMVAGLGMWAQIVGLINLELFGHFTHVVADLDRHFAMHAQAAVGRFLTGELEQNVGE